MTDGAFWADLEARVATEGVDAVLATVSGGLRRVLELEAHHLRGWDRDAAPALLAQQVLTRAHALGLPELHRAARARIDAQRWVALGERRRTQPFSPALVRTLAGHRGGIVDAVFAPDDRLFTVSEDGDLRVWDVSTGTSEALDLRTGARPTFLAVSGDAALLAVAFLDHSIRVVPLAGGTATTVGRHEDWISRLRFLPGAPPRLVSACDDGTAVIWDVSGADGARSLHVLSGHPRGVTAVAVSPDGATVVTCSGPTLRAWDVATGACRQVVDTDDDVFAVGFTDDETLVATSRLGAVHRHDVRNGELRHRTRLDTPRAGRFGPGWPRSVVALPGDRVMVANDDAVVDVWSVRPDDPARARVASLTGHRDHTPVGAVSADGRLAVTGDEAGMLLLWDLAAVDDVPDTPLGLYFDVETIAVSRAAGAVVAGPQQATRLVARDISTGEERWSDADDDEDADRVEVVWFSPSGRTVHTAQGRTVAHRDVDTGAVEDTTEVPGLVKAGRGDHAVVVETTYRPERHHLAVVGASSATVLESIGLPPEIGWPSRIAAAPGLRSVAVAGDAHLLVWDPLSGHTATVRLDGEDLFLDAVAVDDECCHVLATDDGGRAHVWDVTTGVVTVVPTAAGRLPAAAGLAGHRAVTAGEQDGTVTLWDLTRARPITAAPLDSRLLRIAVDGADIVLGDGAGNTHVLALVEGAPAPAVPSPPAATPPIETRPVDTPPRPSLLRRLFGGG